METRTEIRTEERGVPVSDPAQAGCLAALCRCPLFQGVGEETLRIAVSGERTACRSFQPGEEIPLLLGEERALVVLTDGLALAYSTDEKRSVILRSIPSGTAFGVSVLFSDEEPVSVIRAKTAATALYLPASVVSERLALDAVFRTSYIAFLSGRIRFLNRRIACYTAGNAERRLALYLSELPPYGDDPDELRIDLPMTDLSELLDVGRASLYRAFARLSEAGLIDRDDRRVRVLDRRALTRYGTRQSQD